MKKLMIMVLQALPFLAAAQQNTDTITLQNGKQVAGNIYKMEQGKIYIATDSDSLVFRAGEVHDIMLCRTAMNNCDTAIVSAKAANKVFKQIKPLNSDSKVSKPHN
jgi:hypothetical protein